MLGVETRAFSCSTFELIMASKWLAVVAFLYYQATRTFFSSLMYQGWHP